MGGPGTHATVTWNADFVGTALITVAGTNDCGEGLVSQALAVTVDVVGIDEPGSAGLTVYPNPVSSNLYLKLSGSAEGPVTMRIFNILGQKVAEEGFETTQSGQVINIDLSALQNGMYILSVTGQQWHHEQKLIIK